MKNMLLVKRLISVQSSCLGVREEVYSSRRRVRSEALYPTIEFIDVIYTISAVPLMAVVMVVRFELRGVNRQLEKEHFFDFFCLFTLCIGL